MKIGINMQLLSATDAGVGQYARNLADNVTRFDTDNRYFIFGDPGRLNAFDSSNTTVIPTHSIVSRRIRRILWEQLILPGKVTARNLDIMYYPDHTTSFLRMSCPVIITVHDLAFLAFPKTFGTATRVYKSLAVSRSAARADLVIADSEATKRECMRLLDLPEEKLRVVHLGVSPLFGPVRDEQKLEMVRTKYGLEGDVVLYLGTLEPRKNLVRLVQAFHRMKARGHGKVKLVIGGSKGWLFKEIFETVEKLGLSEQVVFTGYVPAEHLPALYAIARVFVYPSLYEGFGIPPLEAMASGCPVVTSNTSSLPEVCGDAAVFVDPYETDEIATAIDRLLDDPSACEQLRAKGFAQAARFGWERTAREHIRIFNEVAG